MSEKQIIVLDTPEDIYTRAAEELTHLAGEAVCIHGEFRLCLAGGSTPRATYELLASRFHHSIDWSEVQFFWGDERCVPPTDGASNFGMAERTMLSKLGLEARQIHRMQGELPPADGAQAYESELQEAFGLAPGDLPTFNLTLLGLGDNAHIASLFPHHPALHETERLAIAVEVDAPERHRITLTAPVLNNSERIIFLVTGEGKADAVKNTLEGPRDSEQFPAQIIAPTQGDVIWLLDKAAAKKLT
ncbi:MAG TPA: 6-phosphogluconolactonase [Candidatus Binataceae bacterium]|nr:6-phosphogluconolactonase [Candidatus Binataceae bacterium]